MAKLTMLGIASLGVGIFGIALIADASSRNSYSVAANIDIVQNVPNALGAAASVASTVLSLAGDVVELPVGMDLSNLLRVRERNYDVRFDNSVSAAIVYQTSVRKIGFGKVSTVNIATTASGTYSSDGLASHHVLYPGVQVSLISAPIISKFDQIGAHGGEHKTGACIQSGSFIYCDQ